MSNTSIFIHLLEYRYPDFTHLFSQLSIQITDPNIVRFSLWIVFKPYIALMSTEISRKGQTGHTITIKINSWTFLWLKQALAKTLLLSLNFTCLYFNRTITQVNWKQLMFGNRHTFQNVIVLPVTMIPKWGDQHIFPLDSHQLSLINRIPDFHQDQPSTGSKYVKWVQ